MLKVSDNLYAESMFYQLAASGGVRWCSAKQGRNYENALFSRLGLNPRDYNVADGSGLSLYNYVSAELEIQLLRHAYRNQEVYNALYEALPIAGVDGTNGHLICFSIINNGGMTHSPMRRFQNKICVALCQ